MVGLMQVLVLVAVVGGLLAALPGVARVGCHLDQGAEEGLGLRLVEGCTSKGVQ